jgi:hypothetical protein
VWLQGMSPINSLKNNEYKMNYFWRVHIKTTTHHTVETMITCSIKVNFDESLESWMGSGASIMSEVGMVWREIETFELQASGVSTMVHIHSCVFLSISSNLEEQAWQDFVVVGTDGMAWRG